MHVVACLKRMRILMERKCLVYSVHNLRSSQLVLSLELDQTLQTLGVPCGLFI